MLSSILWFMAGGFMGIAIAALLCAAGRADEEADRAYRDSKEGRQRDDR
jgi:hypothetical protein